MSLNSKQWRLTSMAARLVIYAESLGFKCRYAFCLRCKDCPIGIESSKHKKYCAIDLDLFKGGKYLTKTKDHLPLGLYWESMGGIWGGRWKGRKADGNHYEI